MKGMEEILRQAQQVQERLAKLQEELAGRTVEASAGGGMVSVVVNGRQEVVSVRIEKEVASPEELELLQDLVRGAMNEALSRSKRMVAEEMSKITGGMNLPGLF
ncbi:MAG TPA: YbaB/EbfC family nucleoid-associated protein [Deltaproteobacteria bacterium]|nr:MAG: nucleoid-associated protein, YbaB/EbfC family [Deltaproteobacteria bacterium GWC2_65_14]HBO70057.1 YbaB/EbfC family nucleoid-associated protein [Deltaproteobacteria bacterium]